MRRHPVLAVAGGAAALIVVALTFLLTFNFKGVFESRASAALEQPVTVSSARLKIFPLRIVLTDLNVGEDPAQMMKAGSVDTTIAFWPLVTGRYVFKRLAVTDAVVVVARDKDGSTNWTNSTKDDGDQTAVTGQPVLPEIRDLVLHNTVLRYRDPKYATDMDLGLETRDRDDGGERELVIDGKGKFQNAPSTLKAVAGSVLALRDSATPYPVDGTFTSGDTSISVKGTITDPVHIAGLNIKLSVKGADTSDLYRITGIVLPESPPYRFTTDLDREGTRWLLRNMNGKLGSSDLSGSLTWDPTGGKPRLEGKLHAAVLDMNDLGGLIGAAPGKATTPEETKVAAANREKEKRLADVPSPEADADKTAVQKKQDEKAAKEAKEAEKRVADKLIVPDKPINLERLNAMNADVTLTAGQILNFAVPVDNLELHIVVTDGVVKLTPLNFGVESGRIAVSMTVDAAKRPVTTDALVEVKNYPINRILGESKTTTLGAIGGRIELRGTGDSAHRLLASSNGTFGLIAQGGTVSQLVVAVLGLQLAEAFGILITEDQPSPIRCVAANFDVSDGLMTTKAFVFDTEKSIITGEGTVDLGGELIDLKLKPKPKKVSLGVLRVPFKVSGSFDNPSIGPDAGALAARGGIAAALGALLSPFASLLAMIETGGGKDADCAALFAETTHDTGAKKKDAGIPASAPPPQ